MTNSSAAVPEVLVVDDDPKILQLLEDVLSDAGYAVTSHDRGQQALDALGERRFNALVLDVWLPDMNGLQICEVARARHSDRVAILMISADSRWQLAVTSVQVCADDFMAKPFDIEELVARIEAKLQSADRAASS